ncbi:MAG: DUF6463 family protein [Rhizobacter sp.]
MANIAAWALFGLGFAHIVFGLIRFRKPLLEAVAAGYVGQFNQTEQRRTAFWFIILGPSLMLMGLVAVHTVALAEFALLRQIGSVLVGTCVAGALAFPKSPFLLGLVIGLLLLAAGYGWVV